jgi:hypothetical protein
MQIYSGAIVHIAIIQLVQSCTTQDVQALSELDAFAQTLQDSEGVAYRTVYNTLRPTNRRYIKTRSC